MNLRNASIYLLAIIVTILGGCLVLVPRASAADASLNQQILPLNCIFQTIDDGFNTLYYITPAACGIAVSSSSPNSSIIPSAPSSSLITPSTSETIHLSTPATGTELGRLPISSIDQQTSMTIIASIGQIFSFDIAVHNGSNAEVVERHTLQIISIDMSNPMRPTVTLRVNSKSRTITLIQHQTALIDLTQDDQPDIGITAHTITASNVTLTLWEVAHQTATLNTPVHSLSAPSVHQPSTLWQLIGGGLLTIILIGYLGYRQRHLSNKH